MLALSLAQHLFKSRWVLALLAVILATLLFLMLVLLSDSPNLGIGAVSTTDGQQKLVSVLPAGPAWDAGLRPGDTVRTISPHDDPAIWGAFEITAGPRAGQTVLLKRPWLRGSDFALFGLGLEVLVIGLIVFLQASDRSAATRFLIFAWVSSIAVVSAPFSVLGQPGMIFVQWIWNKLAVAMLALFFLTTPVQRWRPLQRLLSWTLVPLTLFFTYSMLFDNRLYDIVKPIGFVYLIGGIGIGLAAAAWPFLTRSPGRQRQYGSVIVCSIVAFAMFPIGSLVPYMILHRYLLRPELAVLAWGLLPLGFAWAILRYRLLGVTLGTWTVFQTIFETITDAVFVIGSDGQAVYTSRAGLALLGVTRLKQANQTFEEMATRWDAANEDGMTPGARVLQRVLSGEIVHDEELRLQTADGRRFWVSISGTPMPGHSGEADMAVLVYRDISERKQSEQALQEAHYELEMRVEERTAELKSANDRLNRMLEGAIQAIALTVEMKDPYTAGHQRRVASLACAIAREMGLSEQQLIAINMAASIHDIGKISVPAEILSKPGRLSPTELSLIRSHSAAGHDILKSIEFPWPIALAVLCHHERMDGSGYPSGLSAADIPLEARIIAVADVVEAMAFDRPYRPALGLDVALQEIKDNRGVLYDAGVVDTCLRLFEKNAVSFD